MVLSFQSVDEILVYNVTRQVKATQKFFSMVLFHIGVNNNDNDNNNNNNNNNNNIIIIIIIIIINIIINIIIYIYICFFNSQGSQVMLCTLCS